MNVTEKIRDFLGSSKRILIISKKPTGEEFWQIARITGLGIIVIALIGYVIYLVFGLLGLGK